MKLETLNKIELIPAIDIIGGKCVRLTKGDYNQKTVYNDDPVEVAREFEASDCMWWTSTGRNRNIS